jgi:hypothetical protein
MKYSTCESSAHPEGGTGATAAAFPTAELLWNMVIWNDQMPQHRTTTTKILPNMTVALARAEYPAKPGWAAERHTILMRDKHVCQWCGDYGNMVKRKRCICKSCLDSGP